MKLNKEEKALFDDLCIGTEKEIIENPFSNEKVELCPEAVALYDYIRGCEATGNHDGFHTALDIFIKNWPKEYMILLD